jgi:hypothetical protein
MYIENDNICLWHESYEQWEEQYSIQEETEVKQYNDFCNFLYNEIEQSELDMALTDILLEKLDPLYPACKGYECKWDVVDKIREEYLTGLKY